MGNPVIVVLANKIFTRVTRTLDRCGGELTLTDFVRKKYFALSINGFTPICNNDVILTFRTISVPEFWIMVSVMLAPSIVLSMAS